MFVPETKGKSITEITRLFKTPTVGSSASDLGGTDVEYERFLNRMSTQVLIIDPPDKSVDDTIQGTDSREVNSRVQFE